MGVSVPVYLLLLAAVAAGRLFEMRLSRRNQQRLAARGAVKIPEPHFRWMVLLHGGVLVSAALEVLLLKRPFLPLLGFSMAAVFLTANGLRWWVIRTMAEHWNVQVMTSARLGVITGGPFRWVRHPNYAAVFAELISLPLIHTAWITALWVGLANAWILHRRVAVEEAFLMADPGYRAAMGPKPRFLPKLF